MCFTVDEIGRRDGIQNEINEAAFDQNWIVYGPAGTGKTIIALARLERLSRLLPNEEHVLISKSKLLNRWVKLAAIRMGQGNQVETFDRFVWNRVKTYINQDPFKINPQLSWDEIDWNKTLPLLRSAFAANPGLPKFSLILDEGQDVYPGFFEACKVMCSRVFILMDENQKTEVFANTRRDVIARALDIDERHQKYLGINYRNPEAIKSLSEVFFEGDPNELAELAPEEDRPVLEAPPNVRWLPLRDVERPLDQIRHILGYCRDRPQATICVVAPSADRVQPIANLLRQTLPDFKVLADMDNWRVRVYVPVRNQPCSLDLCEPGIVVSTALNLKGSEYSAVFLAQWEESNEKNPALYTVITRAKTRLEILADPSEPSVSRVRSRFRDALESGLISEGA